MDKTVRKKLHDPESIDGGQAHQKARPVNDLPIPPDDHRIRVGAQRREKTRLRLLKSALEVLSEKGLAATVIDDVIAAAGVSRGTFYNHFRTTNDLLLALAGAMSDEVLEVVKPVVQNFDNPVLRFSVGTRLYMHMAVQYPAWGQFITTVGARIVTRGQRFDEYMTRDLSEALKADQIVAADVLVARTVVLGAITYGIETMLAEPTREKFAENLVATFLRAMGIAPKKAEEIAFMQLPDVGPVTGSIFSMLPTPRKATRAQKSASSPARRARHSGG